MTGKKYTLINSQSKPPDMAPREELCKIEEEASIESESRVDENEASLVSKANKTTCK